MNQKNNYHKKQKKKLNNKIKTNRKTVINDKSSLKNEPKKIMTREEYRKVKKRKQKINILYKIVLITSVFMFLVCLFNIITWIIDNKNIEKITKKLDDENVSIEKPAVNAENINPPASKEDDYWYYVNMDMLSADFTELKKKNPDTVAFIKVNGTNVNYPVVQTNNNEYYLNHAFDKSKNSAGWIFADYRNDLENFSYNTIIYGHSRYDKTMFGSLKNVVKESWYSNKDNHIIKLSTAKENTLWQIFSIYSTPAESYYITTDFNTNSFDEFLKTIKNRSQINFSAGVNVNDKVLTLSTCNNDAGTERLVIHAKLIKKEAR